MQATHRDAEARYSTIRSAVLGELNNYLRSSQSSALKAKLVDPLALSKSKLWSLSSQKGGLGLGSWLCSL